MAYERLRTGWRWSSGKHLVAAAGHAQYAQALEQNLIVLKYISNNNIVRSVNPVRQSGDSPDSLAGHGAVVLRHATTACLEGACKLLKAVFVLRAVPRPAARTDGPARQKELRSVDGQLGHWALGCLRG